MTFALLSLKWRSGIAVPAVLLVGGVMAQAQAPQPEKSKPRQPTLMSAPQQGEQQTSADKNKAELDRKVREMDRRLNRTMRSVCIGC